MIDPCLLIASSLKREQPFSLESAKAKVQVISRASTSGVTPATSCTSKLAGKNLSAVETIPPEFSQLASHHLLSQSQATKTSAIETVNQVNLESTPAQFVTQTVSLASNLEALQQGQQGERAVPVASKSQTQNSLTASPTNSKEITHSQSETVGQLIQQGRAALNNGKYVEAEMLWRRVIQLVPDSASFHYNLGISLLAQGKYEDAVTANQKATELEPNYAFAYNHLGIALIELGKYEKAIVAVQKSIELNPSNAAAYINLGTALYQMGKHEEAAVAWGKSVNLDPDNILANIKLSIVLRDLKKYKESIAPLQQLIELEPKNAFWYYSLGDSLSNLKRYDEVIPVLSEAIKLEPNNAIFYYYLGNAFFAQGRYEKAIKAYEKAIQIEPKYVSTYINLGITLHKLKRYEKAILAYEKAIQIEPNYAKAYVTLGFALAEQEKYTEAVTAYKKAIKIDPQNADTYYRLGYVLAKKREKLEAVTAYEKAIQLDINNAGAHHNLGLEYEKLGLLDKAVKSLQKALQIYESENNVLDQASVLNDLSNAYKYLARDQQFFDLQKRASYFQSAVDARERSISLYNRIGSLPILFEAMLLADLGTLYNDVDKYQSSIEVSNKVLSLVKSKERPNRINDFRFQDLKHSINEIGTTNFIDFLMGFAFVNLGEAHRRLGDDQQSLYAYDIALRLFQPLEMRLKQVDNDVSQLFPFFKGLSLSIMSFSYSNLGFSQRAVDLDTRLQRFIESLGNAEGEEFTRLFIPLFNSFRTIPDEKPIEFVSRLKFLFGTSAEGEMMWHQARGFAYFESKNYNQSLVEYDSALRLLREEANPILRISLLGDKAKVLLSMQQSQKALDIYTQALKLSQQAGNLRVTGDILTQIGEARNKLGEYDQAINVYNEALNLWLRLDIAEGQADIYFKTAQTERTRGNFKQALYRVEQAIETIESKPQIGSSVTLITGESEITPVSNDSQPVTLSGASNKSNENRVNYFQLKQKYYDFYVDLLMELDRQDPEGSYSIQALQANERSRTCSLKKFLEEDNKKDGISKNQQNGDKHTIQSGFNLCLGLKQPLKLAEIQPLLDDETVVLEYALGEEHSYLWVITNKGIASYELPKRQQIEEAATEFYRYLTEPGLRVRPNKAKAAGEKLSQIVLGPISKQLKNQRLLIVADGALQYIPFSVLPDPRSNSIVKGTGFSAMQPLLVKHEILNLPASSILPTLRRSQIKRNQVPRELAIFSDPVFNLEDERLQKALTQPSQGRDRSYLALVKEAIESPQNKNDLPEPPVAIYPRLPGTQDESNRIIEQILKRDPAAKISQFVGFNASYQAATNPELGQYRIVHFATHGLLNSNNPTRSGVVLSSTDEMGGLQRGLLSASDTFKLQLNADLVVVSSCRSGLSADVESGEAIGEGLFGLTGGFINGGAQRVVVSLWSVNDQATAEFMNRFYQYMLDSKSNLTPSQALRKAQLSMLSEQRWQNPYYWAAFTMHGDWR